MQVGDKEKLDKLDRMTNRLRIGNTNAPSTFLVVRLRNALQQFR